MRGGCDDATQSDFALQALIEGRAARTEHVRVVALRWSGGVGRQMAVKCASVSRGSFVQGIPHECGQLSPFAALCCSCFHYPHAPSYTVCTLLFPCSHTSPSAVRTEKCRSLPGATSSAVAMVACPVVKSSCTIARSVVFSRLRVSRSDRRKAYKYKTPRHGREMWCCRAECAQDLSIFKLPS